MLLDVTTDNDGDDLSEVEWLKDMFLGGKVVWYGEISIYRRKSPVVIS
jgi:hypothetical protein